MAGGQYPWIPEFYAIPGFPHHHIMFIMYSSWLQHTIQLDEQRRVNKNARETYAIIVSVVSKTYVFDCIREFTPKSVVLLNLRYSYCTEQTLYSRR